jgi:hypothetical protein
MKFYLFIAAGLFSGTIPVAAESLKEISAFAQSICGDIPEGSITRTEIEGKVKANIDLLTRILGGSGEVNGSRKEETYKGIPFDKLPDNIPTVGMCKSELAKVILARKKFSVNTCRHPDFGQAGWQRSENYTDSSGRVGGGHDQMKSRPVMDGRPAPSLPRPVADLELTANE